MAKIPNKRTITDGIKVLSEVYAEIDKQIGTEQNTKDDKVSDVEVATFLRQRGAASDTVGAAVASVSAYLKHMADGDVSVVSPIVACQPLVVLLLARLVLSDIEQLRRTTVAGGIATVTGAVLVSL